LHEFGAEAGQTLSA